MDSWRRAAAASFALAGVLIVLGTSSAAARPGDLDPSFGSGGTVDQITPDDKDIMAGAPLAIQPDGKIVVAGQDAGGTGSVLLERFTQAGELDPAFGSNGTVLTDVGFQSWKVALALAPNRDIVVAGETNDQSNQPRAIVLRYLPNGSLDTSFGNGGMVREPSGGGTAVAVQPDGKILLGTRYDNTHGAQVFRFTPAGALDATFGDGGMASLPAGGEVDSFAVQPDGRIVLSGSWVMRLMPNGSPDTTFGNNGLAELPAPSGIPEQAVVEPDGRIAVAGYAGSPYEMRVWRLLPNGAGDPAFAGDGGVAVPATASPDPYNPPQNEALAVAAQPDGAILATGYNLGGGYGEATKLETVRLTPSGSLDPSFGDGGRVLTPLADIMDGWADSIALDGTGNVLIGGFGSGEGTGHILLARYEAGPGAVAAPSGTPSTGATGTRPRTRRRLLSLVARRHQRRAHVRRTGFRVRVTTSRRGVVVLRLGRGARASARKTIRVRASRSRRITLHPRRLRRRMALTAQLRVAGRRMARRSLIIHLR